MSAIATLLLKVPLYGLAALGAFVLLSWLWEVVWPPNTQISRYCRCGARSRNWPYDWPSVLWARYHSSRCSGRRPKGLP